MANAWPAERAIQRRLLAGDPRGLLQPRWVHLTLSGDTAMPTQFLRMAGQALDRQTFVLQRQAVEA